MPRDGADQYHIPPGTEGEPDTTIESLKYNNFLADIAQDLNLPRPIVAGGTGADNASAAITALGGERTGQIVTNYDSYLFKAGSFYSGTSATAAPITGHAFVGICYATDANNMILEARDQNDTAAPGRVYIREKKAGVWGAWGVENYIAKIGASTMEGPLIIDPASGGAEIKLIADAGYSSLITGFKAPDKARWSVVLGDGTTETGTGNTGSDFAVYSYTDAGALLDTAIKITRSTGLATVKGAPTADLGIATKKYSDDAIAAEVTRSNAAYQAKDAQLFAGIPINSIATNYVTVATDAQKAVVNWGAGAVTVTISGALYPVGACITIIGISGYVVIANSETMLWRGPSGPASGTRTLGQYGVATALKIGGGYWMVSGNGLT